jgi:hypothetical protein
MIHSRWLAGALLAVVMASPIAAIGQAPAVTATCKDGTSFSGTTRSGACRGHGGVQSWGSTPAAAASPSATPAAPTAAAPAAPAPSPAANQPTSPTTRATPSGVAASAGQVWVNTSTKVYHCPGDRYYGKTKHGEYMAESAAVAAGDKPNRGKKCS